MPDPKRMSPTRSGLATRGSRYSGRKRQTRYRPRKPMGRLTKKMSRQLNAATMRPPASGPSIGPMSAGMATKLIARMSSFLANARTSVSRPTGTIIAPPQPCRTRQNTSMWMLEETPHRKDPSVKSAIAPPKIRRVPKRSAIQLEIGMKTARLSV